MLLRAQSSLSTIETRASQMTERHWEDDCSICLSPIFESCVLMAVQECQHRFHAHCLGNWCRSSKSCPLCRSRLNKLVLKDNTSEKLNTDVFTLNCTDLDWFDNKIHWFDEGIIRMYTPNPILQFDD